MWYSFFISSITLLTASRTSTINISVKYYRKVLLAIGLWCAAIFNERLPGNRSSKHAATKTPPEKQLANPMIVFHLVLYLCLCICAWVVSSFPWVDGRLKNNILIGSMPKQSVTTNIPNKMISFSLSSFFNSLAVVWLLCTNMYSNLDSRFIFMCC